MATQETLLRAADVARKLNCGKSTVYKLAKIGKIPVVRIGMTGVRFDFPAVLASLQHDAGEQP